MSRLINIKARDIENIIDIDTLKDDITKLVGKDCKISVKLWGDKPENQGFELYIGGRHDFIDIYSKICRAGYVIIHSKEIN